MRVDSPEFIHFRASVGDTEGLFEEDSAQNLDQNNESPEDESE